MDPETFVDGIESMAEERSLQIIPTKTALSGELMQVDEIYLERVMDYAESHDLPLLVNADDDGSSADLYVFGPQNQFEIRVEGTGGNGGFKVIG